MCVACSVGYGAVSVVTLATTPGVMPQGALQPSDVSSFTTSVKEMSPPTIKTPKWLIKKRQERAAAAQTRPTSEVIQYTVGTKGDIRSSLQEFSALANDTLNDSKGWSQLGVTFRQVQSGGSFHLILSEASQVPSYSPACSAEWSCRVGASVIINDDRWSGGTTAWNNAGGGLRDYRHMVINHEVGHWLGHGHRSCAGAGQAAPVMQQQSIDLQGCRFNPWPLQSELTSSTLGI